MVGSGDPWTMEIKWYSFYNVSALNLKLPSFFLSAYGWKPPCGLVVGKGEESHDVYIQVNISYSSCPQAGRAFTFSIDEKVNKKSRQKDASPLVPTHPRLFAKASALSQPIKTRL